MPVFNYHGTLQKLHVDACFHSAQYSIMVVCTYLYSINTVSQIDMYIALLILYTVLKLYHIVINGKYIAYIIEISV